MTDKALNPFQKSEEKTEALAQIESNRAMQEVQAAALIAHSRPRDMKDAMDRILQACMRPTLAEEALYAYPRGGSMITGPSIRLAEAIAQAWGNIQFGIRELEQKKGESIVESYAWDLETNCRQSKIFHVKHQRVARGRVNALTDPRDIYEMTANQGARRLRACILGVVPGDVVDAAVRQCEITQQHNEGAPEEQIKKLLEAFAEINIDTGMIETRLGHRIDSTVGAEIVSLRKIYRSIADGMSKPQDWFAIPEKTVSIAEMRGEEKK